MKHLRGLTGRSVFADGRRIGRVTRACLSPDGSRLAGVWVERGLRGARFFAAEDISVLGDVSVHADGAGSRKGAGRPPALVRAVSTDGARVGAVTDYLIDEVTFQVIAVEVTPGFWDELLSGRRVTRVFRPDPEGKRVIVGDEKGQRSVEL